MEIAIMHCRGHQKWKTAPELGNHFADKAAREVAEKGILTTERNRFVGVYPKI